MNQKILFEGAEAKIIKIDDFVLKKIRTEKTYRLEEIDKKIRKSRNKREFKILNKLNQSDVRVPKVFDINEEEYYFTFEYIIGDILKNILDKELLFKAFNEIIKMHKEDVIHGDLTTLNMLVKDKEIYLIDFGLSEISKKIEEKAVDLNLFFNCIKNEHPKFYRYKQELEGIYLNNEFGVKTIERLKNIEKRGRNK
jgi:Kae1-associated kinase Bud32